MSRRLMVNAKELVRVQQQRRKQHVDSDESPKKYCPVAVVIYPLPFNEEIVPWLCRPCAS